MLHQQPSALCSSRPRADTKYNVRPRPHTSLIPRPDRTHSLLTDHTRSQPVTSYHACITRCSTSATRRTSVYQCPLPLPFRAPAVHTASRSRKRPASSPHQARKPGACPRPISASSSVPSLRRRPTREPHSLSDRFGHWSRTSFVRRRPRQVAVCRRSQKSHYFSLVRGARRVQLEGNVVSGRKPASRPSRSLPSLRDGDRMHRNVCRAPVSYAFTCAFMCIICWPMAVHIITTSCGQSRAALRPLAMHPQCSIGRVKSAGPNGPHDQ